MSALCTCDVLYGFKDGSLDYAIEQAIRHDARTQQPVLGEGSPSDDNDTEAITAADCLTIVKPDGQFWKRSEFLKCRRGDKMQDLDQSKLPCSEGPRTWGK